MKRKNSGVTLIALIITIIVLLILAGVTIAMIMGDNGILNQAANASEKTRIGQIQEQVDLWNSEKEIGKTSDEKVTSENDFLQNLKDNGIVKEEEIDRENQIITIGETEIYYGTGSNLTDVYVALYSDGTLVFNNVDEFDESLVIQKYGNVAETDYLIIDNPDRITKVNFANKIVPRNTSNWFGGMENLEEIQNIENLDTSRVISMNFMFGYCSSLVNLDLSSWDTSNVTDMSDLFRDCSSLESLNLSGWDTSNVTSMYRMFLRCNNLSDLDVSEFDTSNVTSMSMLFCNCNSLTDLDLTKWNTENVSGMMQMFEGCTSLTTLDLSNFNTNNVLSYSGMFNEVTADVYIGDNWNSTMTRSATSYSKNFIEK